MSKMDRPLHDQEETIARRAFWAALLVTGMAFFVVGFALSAMISGGFFSQTPQAFLILVFSSIGFGTAVWGAVLIRRGQVLKGINLTYYVAFLIVFAITLLFEGRAVSGGFSVGLISIILILWVYPSAKRRLPIVSLLIFYGWLLVLEVLNPAFRTPMVVAGSEVGPILATLFGVAVIAFLVRQGWNSNIRLKMVTSLVLIALVSISIVGTTVYTNLRTQIRDDIRQRLVNIVSLAALQQDGDLHQTIQNPGDEESAAYQQIKATNAAIVATEPDIAYLYTMRMDQQGRIYFVVDTGPEGAETAAVAELYDDPGDVLAANFAALTHPIAEQDFYTDIFGTFLSAYAPIYNSMGDRVGVVGIDISADTVIAKERKALWVTLGASGAALFVAALVGLTLGYLYARPIISLAATAQKVSAGDLSARSDVQTADEVGNLAMAINQMTSQLQTTLRDLEERVAERTRALETSTEVSRRLSTILDPQQLVREVVEQLQVAFGFYHAHIYLFDEDKQNLVMAGGTGDAGRTMLARGHKVEKERGLVGRAAAANQVVLVSDVTQAAGWLPNPLLPDTKAEVAVPIAIGGEVYGVLDVQHNVVGGISDQDADLILAIANQVAIAVQNAQVYEQTQRQAQREARIVKINQHIQQARSIDEILQVAVQELGETLGSTRASVDLRLQSNNPKTRGSDEISGLA